MSLEILLSSCQKLPFLKREDQWTNKDSSQGQLVAEADSVVAEVAVIEEVEAVASVEVAEVVVIEEEEAVASPVEVAEVPQEAEEEATDSNFHHTEFNLD